MGLETLGQVLNHLRRDKRLVVRVSLDGSALQAGQLCAAKRTLLRGHTLFIETADPRELTEGVLGELDQQLAQAERLKTEVIELLDKGQTGKAMEKLSGCFTIWEHAHESLLKTAQLLRINLEAVMVGDQTLGQQLAQCARQLCHIRVVMENRDFQGLSQALAQPLCPGGRQWDEAVAALRRTASGLR